MGFSKKFKSIAVILVTLLYAAFNAFADSTYVVKKGDTLYSISRKYEITVAELRTANNLSENDVLKEGAKLTIPTADISNAAALSSSKAVSSESKPSVTLPSAVYQVQKGDTLYGIARKYGIKLPELLAMNNLDSNATIKIGQKLSVPAAVSSADSKAGTTKISQKEVDASKAASSRNSVNPTVSVVSGVIWPLSNPSVKNISGKVSGVQLSGRDNEAVKCIREGTVMYTGVYRGFGDVVFIQSKTGLIYSYTGLGSVKAKKGDYVLAGTEIGRTGKGSESSIKFMVFQNGKPVDPVKAPRG
ncbi:MAG: LysM peptidoglycan-binding domain-containing protein [Treponema sp.]|nr:LysM peptidoglycan-binding domain-containing protein [Treponema sp.]